MKKQDFSIFEKKDKKGRITFYYSIYDSEGKRHAFSTGTSDKVEAIKICLKKLAEGALNPSKQHQFSDYARDFYKYGESSYLRAKEARGFTLSLANLQKKNNFINKTVVPYFENKRIDLISYKDIERFLQNQKKLGKSNGTINNYIKTLRPIFNEAQKEHLITDNPMDNIALFKNDSKEKGAFSKQEIIAIFSKSNIEKKWNGNFESYVFNKMAAFTGARIGEIQALKIEDLSDSTITIKHSWSEGFGLTATKTRSIRTIPLTSDLISNLSLIIGNRTSGFIFSHNNGATPITRHFIYDKYKKAMNNFGFTEELRKKRNLTFHSWRHSFASILANEGAPELYIRELTGHKSSSVFEKYTHIDNVELEKYLF